jgi:hypothetical protein
MIDSREWRGWLVSEHQIGDGDVGAGTKFELLANFIDRQLPLIYEVTAFGPPHRVVVRADG